MVVSRNSPFMRSIAYTLIALLIVVLLSLAGTHKTGSVPSVQSTLSRLQAGN